MNSQNSNFEVDLLETESQSKAVYLHQIDLNDFHRTYQSLSAQSLFHSLARDSQNLISTQVHSSSSPDTNNSTLKRLEKNITNNQQAILIPANQNLENLEKNLKLANLSIIKKPIILENKKKWSGSPQVIKEEITKNIIKKEDIEDKKEQIIVSDSEYGKNSSESNASSTFNQNNEKLEMVNNTIISTISLKERIHSQLEDQKQKNKLWNQSINIKQYKEYFNLIKRSRKIINLKVIYYQNPIFKGMFRILREYQSDKFKFLLSLDKINFDQDIDETIIADSDSIESQDLKPLILKQMDNLFEVIVSLNLVHKKEIEDSKKVINDYKKRQQV